MANRARDHIHQDAKSNRRRDPRAAAAPSADEVRRQMTTEHAQHVEDLNEERLVISALYRRSPGALPEVEAKAIRVFREKRSQVRDLAMRAGDTTLWEKNQPGAINAAIAEALGVVDHSVTKRITVDRNDPKVRARAEDMRKAGMSDEAIAAKLFEEAERASTTSYHDRLRELGVDPTGTLPISTIAQRGGV